VLDETMAIAYPAQAAGVLKLPVIVGLIALVLAEKLLP